MAIKKITIISGTGVRTIEVGVDNVSLIEETVNEYPDHTEIFYKCVDKNNKIIARIDNCPVVVDFE